MIDKDFLNRVNDLYDRLDKKRAEIIASMRGRIPCVSFGWYNGHYRKDEESGEWQKESYPIPVVTVKGLCDIEIGFDQLSLSTKMEREQALAYSFAEIMHYSFECYGVENYLLDFCHTGITVEEMKKRIVGSSETEIGFSFAFPFETSGELLFQFSQMLKEKGFFY